MKNSNINLSVISKNSLMKTINFIKTILLENYENNGLWKTKYRTITSVRDGITVNIDSWNNRISISIIGKDED